MSCWLLCESVEVGQYNTVEVHGLRGTVTTVDKIPYALVLTLLGIGLPRDLAGKDLTLKVFNPAGTKILAGVLTIPSNIPQHAEIFCAWQIIGIPIQQSGRYIFHIQDAVGLLDDKVHVEIQQGAAPRTGIPKELVTEVTLDARNTKWAQQWISEQVKRAIREVKIIDPYWDEKAYQLVASNLKKGVRLVIYTEKQRPASQPRIDEVWIIKNYHDRHIVLDDSEFWHIGSSINYLGLKQTYAKRMMTAKSIDDLKAFLAKAQRFQ